MIQTTEALEPNEPTEIESLYVERISAINGYAESNNIDLRYVGSLARHSTLGTTPDFQIGEFGEIKDIDINIIDQGAPNHVAIIEQLKPIAEPIFVEEHFYPNIIYTGNFAAIRYKDIVLNVDPIVFEKYTGNILGVDIPTFNPRTLLYLSYMYGSMRPKDAANVEKYSKDIECRSDLLPEELYRPFLDLNTLASRYYPKDVAMGHLRWAYHSYVPESARKNVLGITKPIWNIIK